MQLGEKLVATALSFYGETEKPGTASNSVILSWIKEFFKSASDDGEIPWCGIFMAKMFHLCRLEAPKGPAGAANWSTVGDATMLADALLGDLLVFRRSGGHHVALFIRRSDAYIYCLGGNQKNGVCIAPYNASDLLHVRRVRP
jgi:uncharacterized protein (TIGR02594 family)